MDYYHAVATHRMKTEMDILANIVIAAVAAAHIGYLILEMFFWDRPLGACPNPTRRVQPGFSTSRIPTPFGGRTHIELALKPHARFPFPLFPFHFSLSKTSPHHHET